VITLKKVGILGGTFDPPHIGHLIIADEVKHQLKFDAIWFIPTNVPPHKNKATSSAQHRLEMVRLATKDNDSFYVNPIEVNLHQTSYTIDTIKQLKRTHPENQFYFIIGADMVEYLPHWKNINQLTELIKFVGVKRTNYTLDTTYPIIEVPIPTIEISSTNIRCRFKQSHPVKYLLSNDVYEYIKEHQLYESE